jgi:hypothetical protein
MGWAAGLERRERRVWVLFFSFFNFETHKLKQKQATTNDAQALG